MLFVIMIVILTGGLLSAKEAFAVHAECEFTVKNIDSKEKTEHRAGKKVGEKVDRFEIFWSCQEYANKYVADNPSLKIIQLKAWFI